MRRFVFECSERFAELTLGIIGHQMMLLLVRTLPPPMRSGAASDDADDDTAAANEVGCITEPNQEGGPM